MTVIYARITPMAGSDDLRSLLTERYITRDYVKSSHTPEH